MLAIPVLVSVLVGVQVPLPQQTAPPTKPQPVDSFANFESTSVHPVRVSHDGFRLFVVHTVAHQLAVYDLLDPASPSLMQEIPVGLEPVSVTPRTDDEVWVANLLSDSISVIDLQLGVVVDTLRVNDEPSDVVFAGGKAFVSSATRDEIHVFDATTRAPLGVIPVFGKEPRALAASLDGTRVYVLIRRSGNGTTVLPDHLAPAAPQPTNPGLPPAPRTGLIIRADDPIHGSLIPYTIPDQDVFEIDVTDQTVLRAFSAVGTTNYDLLVHPISGDLLIANTEAHNLVRFEPNLRGHVVDHRITRVTTGVMPSVTITDLNAGLDYSLLPNPIGLNTALAEPTGIALDEVQELLYVAAQGTDRIGVLDLTTGEVLERIEIGGALGAGARTKTKRGPRGLALHPSRSWLYVANRLSDTLSVIDTAASTVVTEVPIGSHDPVPPRLRRGRKFLYDARLSGNGTMSCSSCHVDGEQDGLAWDLGDPGGDLSTAPQALWRTTTPGVVPATFPPFHPMKGPLVTKTLRGLSDQGRPHWRGDLPDFQAFNSAFDTLLGGQPLSSAEMNLFADWAETLLFPPNPNQRLDRALRTTPAQNNEQAGFDVFLARCVDCHVLPTGTSGLIVDAPIAATQPMKVSPIRNSYRKGGFDPTASTPQKTGGGFIHDGAGDLVGTNPELSILGLADDVMTYLMAFDTGTAPAVGYQTQLDATTAGTPTLDADLALLESRAAEGELDLVAHGLLSGSRRAFLFSPATATYLPDTSSLPPLSKTDLIQAGQAGQARLVFTGVYPGTGAESSIDREGDGSESSRSVTRDARGTQSAALASE